MIKSENISSSDSYDTTINVIGSIKSCDIIYKTIETYFDEADTLKEMISGRNEFNLRTEKSRSRIGRGVEVGFLQLKNQEHSDLIRSIFISNISLAEKELILFWQFALSNRLFREISSQVFIKAYISGRTLMPKDDIIAYVKEILSQDEQLHIKWSESTINTLATKYMNFMTKLNLLEGARKKTFKHIKISSESLVLFLYFAKLYQPENKNILTNDLLPLSFISKEDIQERLKKLSLKGFLNMNFNGVALNIKLNHSYKGIYNALYN